MNESVKESFNTGEGLISIEIIAELAPITPEIMARKQTRAPWLRARDEYFRQMDLENPPEKPE